MPTSSPHPSSTPVQPGRTPADPGGGTTPGIGCPACGSGRLVPDGDAARCSACGHQASSALVREATWLLGEQTRLVTRLTWVQERIAAGDQGAWPATVPAAGAAGASGVSGPSSPGGPSGPGGPAGPAQARPAGPAQPPVGVQTLLLGGGATLLVIAAVVFAAVAWDRIGAWGQLGLLAVVVAALSAAAHGLRTRFLGTAETLAAIGAAVATVGLIAAPHLGLGAAWMRDRSWLWAATALLLVAALSLALSRASGLAAWRIAMRLALLGAAVAACFGVSPGPSDSPAALAVAVLAALGCILLVLDHRRTAVGNPTASGRSELGWLGMGAGGAAVVLALAGYADEQHRFQWTITWAVIAACALTVRVVALDRRSGDWASGGAGVAAGHVPVFAAVAALGPSTPSLLIPPGEVSGATLAATLGLALLGGLTLVATAWRGSDLTGRFEVPIVGAAAAGTVWVLAGPMLATRHTVSAPLAAAYLAVVSVSLFVVAVGYRWPGWPAWPAAAVGSVAAWVLLGDHDVSVLEAYTLSSAGLLLVAGVLVRLVGRRAGQPDPSTMVLAGPALAMALLPSSLWAVGEAVAGQGALRGVLVLAVGAALAVLGAVVRWAAPFAVGLTGAVVAALGQLWTLSDLVPRWVALAAAGGVLVGAGFAVEAIAASGRRFWRFTRALA